MMKIKGSANEVMINICDQVSEVEINTSLRNLFAMAGLLSHIQKMNILENGFKMKNVMRLFTFKLENQVDEQLQNLSLSSS